MTLTGMTEAAHGESKNESSCRIDPGRERQPGRVDRRYASDVRALEAYLAVLERLIPPEAPHAPLRNWHKNGADLAVRT